MSITAIYVRRSVSDEKKDNNSFSIASQKAECISYVQQNYPNEEYRIFCDNGKSGKDIEHRPAFQEMMAMVREGEISRIIVKKIDRFSRDQVDSISTVKELQRLGVGFAALDQKIDFETPNGKMLFSFYCMLAQNEREMIAARVAEAYDTKARETGFYQGGKVYFGYVPERRTINGKTGSVLVPSVQAYAVQKAYEIYRKPEASLSDVIAFIRDNNIAVQYAAGKHRHNNLDSSHLARILESPLYVRANADVYRYFAAQGVEMLDDISAYDGIHGLFLHGKFNNKGGDRFVKVGYHEGLVDADTWLSVQDKKAHQSKFHGKRKGVNTWLVGLVKCAHCGYALKVISYVNPKGTKEWRYFRDGGYATTQSCVRLTPSIRPDEVENAVFKAMKERLNALEIAKKEHEKPNPEVERITAEIVRAEEEIRKLMGKLADANETLFSYIQERVSQLDKQKSELEIQLQKLKRRRKEIDTAPLLEPLAMWDELTVQEKRNVAGQIIEVIRVSDETGVDITFSI